MVLEAKELGGRLGEWVEREKGGVAHKDHGQSEDTQKNVLLFECGGKKEKGGSAKKKTKQNGMKPWGP